MGGLIHDLCHQPNLPQTPAPIGATFDVSLRYSGTVNPVTTKQPGLERSALLLPARSTAAVALAVAVGVFELVALIAPDHGTTRI